MEVGRYAPIRVINLAIFSQFSLSFHGHLHWFPRIFRRIIRHPAAETIRRSLIRMTRPTRRNRLSTMSFPSAGPRQYQGGWPGPAAGFGCWFKTIRPGASVERCYADLPGTGIGCDQPLQPVRPKKTDWQPFLAQSRLLGPGTGSGWGDGPREGRGQCVLLNILYTVYTDIIMVWHIRKKTEGKKTHTWTSKRHMFLHSKNVVQSSLFFSTSGIHTTGTPSGFFALL